MAETYLEFGNYPVVGEAGLEPAHPFGHRNLNPARLPIPPLAHESAAERSLRGLGGEELPNLSNCTLLIMGMSEGCSVNFLMTDSVHDQWIRDCGGSRDTSLEEEIEHEAG